MSEGIDLATLVLWGERDRALPAALSDELIESHPSWTSTARTASVTSTVAGPAAYLELVQALMTQAAATTRRGRHQQHEHTFGCTRITERKERIPTAGS